MGPSTIRLHHWHPARCVAVVLAGGVAFGAQHQRTDQGLPARQWVTVEMAAVRHRAPDAQGEALARFEPRRYPRGLALLESSAAHPPVLERLLPGRWGEPPAVSPMRPAWMWADPSPPVPQTLTPATPEPVLDAPGFTPEPEPTPTPMDEARAAFQAFEHGLVQRRGRWLREGLSLAGAVAGLRRSADFMVLAHGRWLQVLPPSTRPTPLFAQFGERLPGGVFELEGTVSVSQGRYIDIELDLMAPERPVAGDAWRLVRDGYAVLAETRRSRLGEVHYFDHPRFGLVVRVQRVAPPEELLARLRAAEEGS